jgi:hypothetical protein
MILSPVVIVAMTAMTITVVGGVLLVNRAVSGHGKQPC